MICLNCDNEHFAAGEAEVKQEFKGETLMVKSHVMLCQSCGWQTVGNDQIDELRKRTADTYRKKHGLLTTAQIRAMREALGMNQPEFADFLRVGVASVKRWETWLVQEAGNDELIRVKCVLAKKAEIIKRVTNVLLQHATTATPSTDWQEVAHQTQSLLAGLARFLQTAQPGTTHKIAVNVRVTTRPANWLLRSQSAAAASLGQSPWQFQPPLLQPPGSAYTSLMGITKLPEQRNLAFGPSTPAHTNRIANHLPKEDTRHDPPLAAAA
jgi:putative zinc finger/helix-turn-helix YgiT family protein